MNTLKPFGLNIHSRIPLPGLNGNDGPADVSIRYGHVPGILPDATLNLVCAQARPGRFLLTLDNVAKYLVEDGEKITIEPDPAAREEDIRLFLTGTVFSALLLQRGLLPLHGSAIRSGNSAVIFSGPSGNGKSVLAAAFHQKGYSVAADELSAIDVDDNGIPTLLPGFPQTLLWADALARLGIDSRHLVRVRKDLEKYTLPLEKNAVTEPLPVKRLYLLQTHNTTDFNLIPLYGLEKNHAVVECTYRLPQVHGLGLGVSHFRQCSHVARHVDVIRLVRPSFPFDLETLVQVLEKDFHE